MNQCNENSTWIIRDEIAKQTTPKALAHFPDDIHAWIEGKKIPARGGD